MPISNPAPAKLLLVDDDPSVIQAASRLLTEFGRCRFARSAADALRLLRSEPVDLVLLDAEMPEMSGFELLALMQRSEDLAEIPVVLLTSHMDEATEEAAFQAGAVDYLSKPIRPGVLKARIGTQLRLRRALAEVRQLSRTDALTGLANRRAMQERLEQEVSRSARAGSPLSVLLIDVDYFKGFNDHYGHVAGDRALVQLAACLREAASRASDLSARWGGEEFVAVLSDTDEQGALAVANNLHQRLLALDLPHEASPFERLTASVGIVTRPGRSRPAGEPHLGAQEAVECLIAEADAALYRAKAQGRNRSLQAGRDA